MYRPSFILVVLFLLSFIVTEAQLKLYTKSAEIRFFSHTVMEDISARNNKAVSIWVPSTGQIEFSVLMKGFEFKKALMQEHFNENFVESDQYPKAIFKGVIEKSNWIALTKDSSYTVTVKGNLTIHGVTKEVTVPAIIKVKDKVISASAEFSVLAADYKIKIPTLVADKINERIAITISVPAYQILSGK